MAVSKRLRYEVLRRDNHACRYCGGRAPDVALTVDHVVAATLGGSDDPSNLVAACGPCNSGKSATPVDAPMIADVEQDALRWALAISLAGECLARDQANDAALISYFDQQWRGWTSSGGDEIERPLDWPDSILAFRRAGLPIVVIEAALECAMRAKRIPLSRVFKYFCGICWHRVREQREIAASLITVEDTEGSA